MTTYAQSRRTGLRPSRAEVWALRIAQHIERIVERRMQRREDHEVRAARRQAALEYRRDAFAAAYRGLHR